MKFLVDAQLPYSLCALFRWHGFDCIHTDDLPNQERTTDEEICYRAEEENRIVVSKDSDFLLSHRVKGIPQKLILVTTGNIPNKKLMALFQRNLEQILHHLQNSHLIEIDNSEVTVYS